MNIHRRDVLKAGAAGLLAVPGCGTTPTGAGDPNNPDAIIDTHQHLWDFKKFKSPWLADPATPRVLARPYDTAAYRRATDGLNIHRAVYLEVDVAEADLDVEAAYVIGLSKSPKHPTAGAVISGRPESPAFAAYIDKYKNTPEVKGVRRLLQVPSAKPGLCTQPQFIKGVRHLGELGMSFDICIRPMELADAATLVAACPDTQFVIDHCGNGDPKAFLKKPPSQPWHDATSWKKNMDTLARRPNTVCKISGIVARAPKVWRPSMLAPMVNHCLDVFGPDRVLFGSDWPVCRVRANLREWVIALNQIVADRPVDQRRRLFQANARRVYKLS